MTRLRKFSTVFLSLSGAAVLATAALPAAPAGAARDKAMGAATSRPAPSRPDRPEDPIAHDPTMVKEGKYFYVVITGDIATHTYLPIKRSTDLVHWTTVGTVFVTLPDWVSQQLRVTPGDAWAPDLNYVNGHWALYYAASQFGTQNSVIGLATTPTLDPASPNYHWTDRGMVLRSTPGQDDFNAIDPEYSTDAQGDAWLAFGSFWGGIKMRHLDAATGKLSTADTTLYSLSSRIAPDAEEGASILRRGGCYYLFVSFDFCCRGVNSDYRVMVGRSRDITGPYLDQVGVPMTDGGGTEVLRGYNEFIGTGGADVQSIRGVDYFVNHYYDATDDGTPKLNVRTLSWSAGWPRVGDPINPSRSIGHGDAYLTIINRNSGLAVANAGCGYEGANIDLETQSGNDCQQWQFYYRGGGAYSILNRFSNKVAEVAACNNVDSGNVAQWGWIGFLPNNDCQRWTPVATDDGWTFIQSILTGSRSMNAAGCGTAPGTNVDIVSPLSNSCQQFRFEPSGRVLIADPGRTVALAVPGCHSRHRGWGHPRHTRWARAGCQEWVFTSAGGAAYTITNARTGQRLSSCERGRSERYCLTRSHGKTRAGQLWTLQPTADGHWTLASLDARSRSTVSVLIP